MSCSIPVSGPVWSVSWSPHNSHQLLLGLDKGRIAVADIRKSSSQALMLTSNASSSCRPFQPLHSVIPLAPCQVQQLCSSGGGAAVWDNGSAPEAVVACAGEQYVQRVQYNPTQANCKQRLKSMYCLFFLRLIVKFVTSSLLFLHHLTLSHKFLQHAASACSS